jgi:hypothetical protein
MRGCFTPAESSCRQSEAEENDRLFSLLDRMISQDERRNGKLRRLKKFRHSPFGKQLLCFPTLTGEAWGPSLRTIGLTGSKDGARESGLYKAQRTVGGEWGMWRVTEADEG